MEECLFTKINTPPWVFFTFFKSYKWYQIAKGITYIDEIEIIIPGEVITVGVDCEEIVL